ncbi:FAD-binding domain-containing protein [Ascodesmis nigricans]|uniref:FAD-binding domain-containing protein n=1 Tax=Ascodesmis nigricans TaxID=341454 RepID=A0A4S2MT42_9PEZI|nr:FAD-binding domain-containing protein [Ascodesmis nigricans]
MVLPGLLCGLGLLCPGQGGGGVSASVAATCKTLGTLYPAEVLLPNTKSYETETTAHWASNAILPPGCILTPSTPKIASTMLHHLTTTSTPFSIRSGGHSNNPSFSSIQNGILLSLSSLRRITLSPETNTVLLDSGLRWGEVYSHLSPLGFTVAGGRAESVGVGGLSLGGGISFYAYTVGFGCDNIVGYLVLLPSSEIKEVTATSDPELFRALKGSGGRFLVVLAFRYRLIQIDDQAEGKVWGGMTYSTGLSIPGVLRETARFNAAGPVDEDSHLISTVGMVAGVVDIALTITVHTKLPGKGETPEVFKPFRKAQGLGTTTSALLGIPAKKLGPARIEEISDGQSPDFVYGKRQIMKQLTVSNPDEEYLSECVKVMKKEFFGLSAGKGAMVTLSFIPLGKVISKGRKQNVMGIENRDRLMSVHFNVIWDKERIDEEVYEAVDKAIGRLVEEAKGRGIWERWVYMNYAMFDQDVIASYGEEERGFLRGVERRVDPDGVWKRLVKGGFKISE